MVAGIVADILAYSPALTAAEVRNILRDGADKIGPYTYASGRNDFYGYGRVNLYNSLQQITSPPVVSHPNPGNSSAVTAGSSGQLLRIKALGATGGTIYYDDDSDISFNAAATVNGDYLEITIPYGSGKMKDNGTNYWYVEATNATGMTRYPVSGNLSFTVAPLTSDTDNDGIDDSWEMNYFGDLTTVDAASDFDRDGYTDL
ncbi:MAG: hypothetical protein D3924_07090, partial [Candidatus Electrothrix sp. AR4]|nr:hypothetical protein [Candidatus Electrothrix sp. AR4]